MSDRRKQIEEAAKVSGISEVYWGYFIEGALWSDANPQSPNFGDPLPYDDSTFTNVKKMPYVTAETLPHTKPVDYYIGDVIPEDE